LLVLQGPYQSRKFPSDIFKSGSWEAADFPTRRVCLAYWTLCSPQKRVSYNYDLSFPPCGGGSNTGDRSFWSWQLLWCRRIVLPCLLTGPPHLKPHTYCAEARGEAWWARRWFACCPDCGLVSTHCFPLRPCLHPGGGILDPFDHRLFLVAVPAQDSVRSEHSSITFAHSLTLSYVMTDSHNDFMLLV